MGVEGGARGVRGQLGQPVCPRCGLPIPVSWGPEWGRGPWAPPIPCSYAGDGDPAGSPQTHPAGGPPPPPQQRPGTARTPEVRRDMPGCSSQNHSRWDWCPHNPTTAQSCSRPALMSRCCLLVKLNPRFVSKTSRGCSSSRRWWAQASSVTPKGRQGWAGGSTGAAARRDGPWRAEGDLGVPTQLGAAASPKVTAHPRPSHTSGHWVHPWVQCGHDGSPHTPEKWDCL